MLSPRLTAIVTFILVAALAPAAVSGIQCWQCAAVDGRKCPDNSNMVDSPQVKFISLITVILVSVLTSAEIGYKVLCFIQGTCPKFTQLR